MHASLLLAEGHPQANRYPLSKLWNEAEIARERINAHHATQASLMQSVIVAVLAPNGNGVENLNQQLKRLQHG